eukprot:TRINITY_DN16734_c0_g1_i1.p1 TRINITY_DN16734_c0_g1~~TRINITY_DN16734_c0_g1_i1.p1  ORF type:complete len:385 (-),score=40.90 TRINITY_DN16734_c0_g1_i1:17-1171(-)
MNFIHTIYSFQEVNKVVERLKDPVKGLKVENRGYIVTTPMCFVANEAVTWLQEQLRWSPDQAVFFLRLLATRQIIHSTKNPLDKFMDNGDYWRFQCHEECALNCKHLWTLPVEESPCVLVENVLKKLLHLIQLAAPLKTETGCDATLKALERIVPTRAYDDFIREVAVLQKIPHNSVALSEDEKFSFWINVYNLLSIHTLVLYAKKQTNPFQTSWYRRDFFGKTGYVIGGHEFSLDAIKNGILRAATYKYFADKDPRKQFQVSKRDYRIHSVLTTFNKSSPRPTIVYHDRVDWCLDQATKNYFHATVRLEDSTIFLPYSMYEFPDDFQVTKETIGQFLHPLLNRSQRASLAQVLKTNFIIKYLDYDWEPFVSAEDFEQIMNTRA